MLINAINAVVASENVTHLEIISYTLTFLKRYCRIYGQLGTQATVEGEKTTR